MRFFLDENFPRSASDLCDISYLDWKSEDARKKTEDGDRRTDD